jgi:hypothetical protein
MTATGDFMPTGEDEPPDGLACLAVFVLYTPHDCTHGLVLSISGLPSPIFIAGGFFKYARA